MPSPATLEVGHRNGDVAAEEEVAEVEDVEVASVGTAATAAAPGIDGCLAAVSEAMALKKTGYKPAAAGKAKGKAKGKGKAKAAAVPKGKGKAKGKASAPTKAGRPPMQPFKKMPVLRYLGCSIYTSPATKKWRAVSDANRRYDKAVAWSRGVDGWNDMMAWCESNGTPDE